jgi:hypothetical protein
MMEELLRLGVGSKQAESAWVHAKMSLAQHEAEV